MLDTTLDQICQICQIETLNLGYHVSNKHQISSKEYYDEYLKIPNEDVCNTCNINKTKFRSFKKGYKTFCSVNCGNSNKKLLIQRASKRKQTYLDDPNISQNAIKKFKETYKNNPSLSKEAVKRRLKKLEDNPSTMIAAMKKREETYKNNPHIKEKWRKNLSIAKRNTWNRLRENSKDILYYLYLIRHSTKPIIKIGVTWFPEQRLYRIRKHFGECDIIHLKKDSYDIIKPLEDQLHLHFNNYCKVQPNGDGKTEWFDDCIIEEVILLIDQKSII